MHASSSSYRWLQVELHQRALEISLICLETARPSTTWRILLEAVFIYLLQQAAHLQSTCPRVRRQYSVGKPPTAICLSVQNTLVPSIATPSASRPHRWLSRTLETGLNHQISKHHRPRYSRLTLGALIPKLFAFPDNISTFRYTAPTLRPRLQPFS